MPYITLVIYHSGLIIVMEIKSIHSKKNDIKIIEYTQSMNKYMSSNGELEGKHNSHSRARLIFN